MIIAVVNSVMDSIAQTKLCALTKRNAPYALWLTRRIHGRMVAAMVAATVVATDWLPPAITDVMDVNYNWRKCAWC